MIDRDLAVLLHEAEERAAGSPETMDEAIDSVPVFDEGELPDPFAQLPKGLG